MKNKIVAFVPVKGTSERVPNKNMRAFNGEPFFVFTLRKLLRCPFIDQVVLDSDSEEILDLGRRLGAQVLKRDPSLSSNQTDGNQLLVNQVRHFEADIYVQHLCTSPFVKEETIQRAVELLSLEQAFDSVVLGKRDKYYHWSQGQPVYDMERIPNSVTLPDTDTEAMALYVIRRDAVLKTRRRIGDSPAMIFGDPVELIDVNNEADLDLARIVAAGILAEEGKRLRLLASLLSSPVLSDILDEMGLQGVLPPRYMPNVPGAKIFGRARPLHIRQIREGDPPDSIYEALKQYSVVVGNDIIVVQNDRPDLAYFGELNMSLAIRAGATGALIAGVTRDNEATRRAGFPVFSHGNYCKDIKLEGAVASINQPVTLDGIRVNPSDLIFGDEDGVLVVPRQHERRVLARALEVLRSERRIISDVCNDADVQQLVDKHGFF